MAASPLDQIQPLRRFEALYAGLCQGEDHCDDAAWIRFTAQAAILCPDEPPAIVAAIRRNASDLKALTPWSDALRSPLRFVVGAILVHDATNVRSFLDNTARVRRLFHEVKLSRPGVHELLAIMTLMAIGGAVDRERVERIKAIHDRMKDHHWWITGPDDLPACALLAGSPGTPSAIADRAEGLYLALADVGLLRGNHLQTAANLLCISGFDPKTAVDRFKLLADRLTAPDIGIWYELYDGIALLTMLDHDPDLVISHFVGVLAELAKIDPPVLAKADYQVSADLTFLDLVRFDCKRECLTAPYKVENMLRLIHLHRAASMLLIGSTIEPRLLDLDWLLPERGI